RTAVRPLQLLERQLRPLPDGERLRRHAGQAMRQVQDYGEGIQPQQKESIFSRFSSLDRLDRGRSGLGLGLFIAREIVTAHGGTIDVASTPGEGTTFTVCLPLAPAPGAD
ncbi:MAG: ATP-binding protein, partial [Chloroflexota bacterium]|nr:ATP-binding protein [Chloroflexota bacterium]